MSNKDLTKKELRKIKGLLVFDEETSSKIEKKIDPMLEKLDKELAKKRKIIQDNNKKILETASYEQLLKAIQLG